MPNSSERRRAFTGPVFFSHGFRSFFMYAGIWAALAMLIWIISLATGRTIPSRMSDVDWHMHEMVFGYSSAVIAGFLLTAIPNWTGRLPIIGWPTALLSSLWIAGRLAIFFSGSLPPSVAPIIDVSFLLIFDLLIAREIILGKNWKNLKILIIITALATANIIFHVESLTVGAFDGYGIRMGVGLIILLISVVGGRVIPSFTRNWLAQTKGGRLPAPFSRFDVLTLAITGIALVSWVLFPLHNATRALALTASILHTIRLIRWVGWRTLSEPLVSIMHIAYLFIPLGFITLALSDRIPHAFVAGAIGLMTLAMMTRASLGHSGRKITATFSISAIYLLVLLAVLARMLAEFFPQATSLLHLSATAWITGFALYAIVYFPILTRPRLPG